MSSKTYLSIGDVLSLLRQEFPDVTISKIRFLESQGLVNPERSPSGYRKFYDHDVERLRWVLRQQREHFLPLKVIRDRLGGDGEDLGDEPLGAGEEGEALTAEVADEGLRGPDAPDRDVDINGAWTMPSNGSGFSGPPAAPATPSGDVAAYAPAGGPEPPSGPAESAPAESVLLAQELVPPQLVAEAAWVAEPSGPAPRLEPAAVAARNAAEAGAAEPSGADEPTDRFAFAEAPSNGGAALPAPAPGVVSAAVAPASPPPSQAPSVPPPSAPVTPPAPMPAPAQAPAPPAPAPAPPPSVPPPAPGPMPIAPAGSAEPAPAPAAPSAPAPAEASSPVAPGNQAHGRTAEPFPVAAGGTGGSFTIEELATATGLSASEITALEGFGLIEPVVVAGAPYHDEESLAVAKIVADFARFGIEPRHLRLYRNAVEREIGLIEQIITPLLRQRNPESRQRAVDAATELSELGESLRGALLRRQLRRQLGI